MTKRKQFLQALKGDWTAGHISVSYTRGVKDSAIISKSEDIFQFIKSVWNRELMNLQEQMMAFYFNNSHKLIGYRLISTSTINGCMVDVKLVVSLALHCMATSVIIAHNHSSGNLKPSTQDIDLTFKIKKLFS